MKKSKHFVAALLGTVFEYYDFALYGFLAVPFSKIFFPAQDPTISLLETYGILAASSLSKPLGALIFSHFGDKYGRLKALSYNLIGVGVPTFIIACLPGYDSWGFFSPLFLLICRIIQGIFLGGEFDGVSLYVFEHLASNRRCLANSILFLSTSLGGLGASLAVSLATSETMPSWAWRLPFICGAIFSLLIVCLRSSLKETPLFLETKSLSSPFSSLSWLQVFKNFRYLLVIIFITGAVGGLYQFCFIFLGPHLNLTLGNVSFSLTSFDVSIGLFLYNIMLPISGFLGDHIGADRLFKLGALCGGTASLILLTLAFVNICLLQNYLFLILGMMGIFLAFLSVSGYVLMMDLFPVQLRYRGLSLGHTLGNLIFAKNTPFVCQLIVQQTALPIAPFFYFVFLGLLANLSIFIRKGTFKFFFNSRKSNIS